MNLVTLMSVNEVLTIFNYKIESTLNDTIAIKKYM